MLLLSRELFRDTSSGKHGQCAFSLFCVSSDVVVDIPCSMAGHTVQQHLVGALISVTGDDACIMMEAQIILFTWWLKRLQ